MEIVALKKIRWPSNGKVKFENHTILFIGMENNRYNLRVGFLTKNLIKANLKSSSLDKTVKMIDIKSCTYIANFVQERNCYHIEVRSGLQKGDVLFSILFLQPNSRISNLRNSIIPQNRTS